jgi:hypothetical protein
MAVGLFLIPHSMYTSTQQWELATLRCLGGPVATECLVLAEVSWW